MQRLPVAGDTGEVLMAKEKFVRSKPHVNFLDGIKEKLGLAPKEPVEPPIEPLDEADEAPDAGGSMVLPRVGWEVDVSHDGGDADAPADDLGRVEVKFPTLPGEEPSEADSLATSQASDAAAMFNPKELSVDKSVPWKQAEEDAFKVETGEDGSSHVEFGDGAQGAVPPARGPVQSEYEHGGDSSGQNDVRFMKSRSGHQMDADEDNESLGAEQGSIPGTQHDNVYQHNQTDLQFVEEPASGAETEEGGLNEMVHKLPGGSGDAPGDGSFVLPEVGDEVLTGFEHGDMNQPVVIGQLWNGEDAPPEEESVLVELKASEQLVAFEVSDADDGGDADVDDDPDLDD
jgi:hypothetical protein